MGRARWWAAGACLCVLSAHAEAPKKPFQIAPGAAAAAIADYARQADLRVLADGEEVAGIQTNAVSGQYAPAQALELLLKGTRLRAENAPNGTILIKPAAPAPPAPPAP